MNPKPIESLDEIIISFAGAVRKETLALGTSDPSYEVQPLFSPFKQQLEAYITERERLARGCVDCKTLRCENCERLWQS